MDEDNVVYSREMNLRNRGVLHQHVKEQPYVTQDDLEIITKWSRSYIGKLLNWLERDNLVAWIWGRNAAGKRRRQYIDSSLLPSNEVTERNNS